MKLQKEMEEMKEQNIDMTLLLSMISNPVKRVLETGEEMDVQYVSLKTYKHTKEA
jgi:hypothetical protein